MSSSTFADQAVIPPVRAPAPAAIVRMLAWRYVRHGWTTILAPLGIFCGVPTLLYVMIRLVDAATAANLLETGDGLKPVHFLLMVGTLPTLVVFELARVRPLYTLPLTTRQIVHVQLGLGVISVIGLHLAIVLYYRVVFGAAIPVVGPLLFLVPGLLIASGLAALLIDARWWKPLVVIAALVFLGNRSVIRFSDPSWEAVGAPWFTPTGLEMLGLVVLAVVGYVLVRHTAAGDRCGETQPWAVLEEYLHRLMAWLAQRLPSGWPALRVDSPMSAQFAFEWRMKGIVLPVIVLVFGSLSLIGAYYEPREWLQAYIKSLPFLLMMGMAINGLFVGMLEAFDGKGLMDHFRATRPLSDWQLAVTALKNGLASTAVALMMTIALACLVYVYACLCGHTHVELWSSLFDASNNPIWGGWNYLGALATLAMLGWAGMGFNLTCISTGRLRVVTNVWLGGIALLILSMIVEKQMSAEQWERIAQAATIVVAIVAIATTVLGFQQAAARGLIAPGVLAAAAIPGLLAAVLTYAALYERGDARGTLAIAAIGVGALAALPLASVPLAIACNRHR